MSLKLSEAYHVSLYLNKESTLEKMESIQRFLDGILSESNIITYKISSGHVMGWTRIGSRYNSYIYDLEDGSELIMPLEIYISILELGEKNDFKDGIIKSVSNKSIEVTDNDDALLYLLYRIFTDSSRCSETIQYDMNLLRKSKGFNSRFLRKEIQDVLGRSTGWIIYRDKRGEVVL